MTFLQILEIDTSLSIVVHCICYNCMKSFHFQMIYSLKSECLSQYSHPNRPTSAHMVRILLIATEERFFKDVQHCFVFLFFRSHLKFFYYVPFSSRHKKDNFVVRGLESPLQLYNFFLLSRCLSFLAL